MIEEGEIVKVKGKRGTFIVRRIIEDESGILGYHVTDKDMRQHAYRVETVRPKKKKTKRKSRKKSGST